MLTYTDSYLKNRMSEDLETRAMEDVAQLGTFPDPWPGKLAVIRAYILCCLENVASDEDTFSVKLKQYQGEWKTMLQQAQIAAGRLGATPGIISIPVERG